MSTPNILIIVADDIGVDAFRIDKTKREVTAHVTGQTSTAGPVRLPNFERMLEHGVHFEHAWAHPVCTPTRASLWTGNQAWKTTLGYPTGGGDNLPGQTVTGASIQSLAQALTGYRCAMFGKWDLGLAKNPVDWGWDHFAGIYRGGLRPVGVREYGFPRPPSRVSYARLKAATDSSKADLCRSVADLLAKTYDPTFLDNNPDLRFYIWHKDSVSAGAEPKTGQPPSSRAHLYATEDQVADAKQWIADNRDGGPWCVALSLITPHDPFHVPPPGTFRAETISDPANPTVQEMLVAMLESMDHYVGDLLAAIDDQLDNTVVIFVGDNGTQDVDRDTGESVDEVVGDDKSTYQIGGVHVPMIIADGGRMKGLSPAYATSSPRSVAAPVHIIDVYRTALDIAGVSASAPADSLSIAPHLTGSGGSTRTHNFSQMYISAQVGPDGKTALSPGINASASEGAFKLTCRALLGSGPQGTFLVDAQGNPVPSPVYTYDFSRLDPEPGIPGSSVETLIDAIARDGDRFRITDPSHADKIMELHAVLDAERIDSDQTHFPYIDDEAAIYTNGAVSLQQGQSVTVPGIDLHAGDFTIATKVKLASTSNRNIILGNWGSQGRSWQMLFAILAGGAPQIALRRDMDTNGSNPKQDLLGLTASTSISAGAWRHVAVTFTWGRDRVSPRASLYVDGALAGQADATIEIFAALRDPYTLMPTSNPYQIGRKQDSSDSGSWFTGELQDFRIYRCALAGAAIQQLASA